MRPREARATIKLEVAGAETELMMTASPLGDTPNEPAGTVLFFEDVSQIAKVERMEAWREVARRIAHEIKNPLTPIQLSAERIRRQLGSRPGPESALVEECTRVIIGEVEDLKRLVNEFSAFARMPHLNPVPGDINALASETVANFREANPNVDFAISLDSLVPLIPIDRDAMKRALVNLLDNAVAAATSINHNGDRPRIEVQSRCRAENSRTDSLRLDKDNSRAENSIVTLEVADNGPGIDPRLRTRIFEPYYSSKKGGTGLGLAIVSAVVADHHGFIRVTDNQPCGSRFTIEFPLKYVELAKATA
jgi:two-component system nitrogen regulation sensor histidine kinase NtrY